MQDPKRRDLLLLLSASSLAVALPAACDTKPNVYAAEVHLDPGCGCCRGWVEILRASPRFVVTSSENADLPVLKQKLGVPAALGSCHTAIIEGLVVEGHVPVTDVIRLLETRPAGVIGIAAPGMPRGSPGMEQPNGVADAYDVLSFTKDGQHSVFASYKGRTT